MQHALVTLVHEMLVERRISGEELMAGLLQSLADEHGEVAFCAVALNLEPPHTTMSDLEDILRLRSMRSSDEAEDLRGDPERAERRQRLSVAQLAAHLLVRELRLLSEQHAKISVRRIMNQEHSPGFDLPPN